MTVELEGNQTLSVICMPIHVSWENAHIFLGHECLVNFFGYDRSKHIQHSDLQPLSGTLAYHRHNDSSYCSPSNLHTYDGK